MNLQEEHRRVYDEDQDIPRWLKWVFVTINRVGFPIVAFVLMWYMSQVSITKVIASVAENTAVLTQVRDELQRINYQSRHG